MFGFPLRAVSPGGRRGRLSILIFHRVLPSADPLLPDVPTAEEFERQMRWVRAWFSVLPLAPAIEMLYEGRIPSRALAITFDDGYADNEEVAAPILHRLGLTATFFISTGFLSGGCMWNDRVIEAFRACDPDHLDLRSIGLADYPTSSVDERKRAIGSVLGTIKRYEPEQRQAVTESIVALAGGRPSPGLMMSEQQVRALRGWGMDVGAHTVSHPILTRLRLAVAQEEMQHSKQHLERILGERVNLFAYPNGVPTQDYAVEHAVLARESGFDAAVSTAWGAASTHSERFQLPRFTPWDRTRLRYGARLLMNLTRNPEVAV